MKASGLDTGLYVPLSAEGLTTYFDSPIAALRNKDYLDAFYRMSLYIFNGAEKVNRAVTGWGAYQKFLLENGGNKKLAAQSASEIVRETQFVYRLSDTPAILRGPIGGTLLQFKSYFIKEMEFIASLRGPEIVRFASAAGAMGGAGLLLNIPGADLIDKSSTIFFDRKISEALDIKSEDSIWASAVAFGLPGMVGVDVSDYVGVGGLDDLARGVAGPAGSDLKSVADFIWNAALDIKASGGLLNNGRISQETADRFVQKITPSTVRKVMRSYDIVKTGDVKNPYTGKLIYQPENRFKTALIQALGAPETRMTVESSMDAIATRARNDYIRGRRDYAREAARAALSGNSEDLAIIRQQARASGYMIDNETLGYYMKDLRRPARERRGRSLPIQLRADLEELYQATGGLELE